MKRLIAALLMLLFVFSLAACKASKKEEESLEPSQSATEPTISPEEADAEVIRKYVEDNSESLIASMNDAFAASSGKTCTTTLSVEDGGIVVSVKIEELENLSDEDKALVQTTLDAQQETFDNYFAEIKEELPQLRKMSICISDKNDVLLALIEMS